MNDKTELGYKLDDKHCFPEHPVPEHHDDQSEDCEGHFKIHCERHCHQLKTRTFVLNIGPQTEASLRAFEVATFAAWEAGGFLLMAHSVVDTGAGWMLTFTVGFYV